MVIERTEPIQWHVEGTLRAVTRWVSSHDEGIAELLKNTRRAYQPDRLDVDDAHRAAVLLLRDGEPDKDVPARMGLLDVGGASFEDVEAWSIWHDPNASSRRSGVEEEETQGNGGKAYLYAMYTGQSRILGVADRKRNCKGFEGPPNSEERGTPGWIPSEPEGCDVVIASFEAELNNALAPYGVTIDDLPQTVREGIKSRQAFTLVEGVEPIGLYKSRIDADDLIARVLRHEQTTLVVEQLETYAVHNGKEINSGKKLQLPPIPPYPGLEPPLIFPIPEQLELTNGQPISTTDNGVRAQGRLSLYTSKDNMPNAYKYLRPRWKVSYKTKHQSIGAKSVSELVPGTSGAAYVYATVEVPALEPGYVETGRKRPKDGPLLEAVDLFVAEKIRELAKQINDLRKQELDERSLDQVHEENRKLDEFKNSFLPSSQGEGGSGEDEDGNGEPPVIVERRTGTEPAELEYTVPDEGVQIADGVTARMSYILNVRVRDIKGWAVPSAKLEWFSSEPRVASFSGGVLKANSKGKCDIWAKIKGTTLKSEHISVQVWAVEHVFLAPREMELAVGKSDQVTAVVTDEDGQRSADVLLTWRHDAENQMLVLVGPRGRVTANREGRTAVSAGAGEVWAKRPVEVLVTRAEEDNRRAGGFPRLLLTDRDIDPATGQVREGNPDSPALWQDPVDFVNNVWWLNLQSPEAAYAFKQRTETSQVWRMFHVGKTMEMVELVWLDEE